MTPATPYLDDYERRRRAAETLNERIVSMLIVALTGSTLLVQIVWNLEFPFVPVPNRVELVSLAIVAAHVGVVAAISLQRGYSPLRKYVIVVMRMALLGCLCWAEWRHTLPEYGLIRPTSLFAVTIVLAALSYSRAAVVLAGTLACVLYPGISLLGPAWPASLHASIFAVQLFIAVTAAAYRIVSEMRTMSDESVSNERLRPSAASPCSSATSADSPPCPPGCRRRRW